MGKIVTLSGAQHLETQSLLPWYVSRRLDASDCARVEAHLVECPECRADLAAERRLMAEWATMPIETEASWLRLRERVVRDGADRADSGTVFRLANLARHTATRWQSRFVG